MTDTSTSPVLRTKRGHHRSKHNSLQGTALHNLSDQQDEHTSSSSNSVSLHSSVNLKHNNFKNNCGEQCTNKSGIGGENEDSNVTTPKYSKKQKFSFTPCESSNCVPNKRKSEDVIVSNISLLDDTVVNFDFDSQLEHIVLNKNVLKSNVENKGNFKVDGKVENLSKNSSKVILEPTSTNITPKMKSGKGFVRRSYRRNFAMHETYTSPNKFQLKVRRKIQGIPDNPKTTMLSSASTLVKADRDKYSSSLTEKLKKTGKCALVDKQSSLKDAHLLSEHSHPTDTISLHCKNETVSMPTNLASISHKTDKCMPKPEDTSSILNQSDCCLGEATGSAYGKSCVGEGYCVNDFDCSVLLDSEVLQAFDESFTLDTKGDSNTAFSKNMSYESTGQFSPDIFAEPKPLIDSLENEFVSKTGEIKTPSSKTDISKDVFLFIKEKKSLEKYTFFDKKCSPCNKSSIESNIAAKSSLSASDKHNALLSSSLQCKTLLDQSLPIKNTPLIASTLSAEFNSQIIPSSHSYSKLNQCAVKTDTVTSTKSESSKRLSTFHSISKLKNNNLKSPKNNRFCNKRNMENPYISVKENIPDSLDCKKLESKTVFTVQLPEKNLLERKEASKHDLALEKGSSSSSVGTAVIENEQPTSTENEKQKLLNVVSPVCNTSQNSSLGNNCSTLESQNFVQQLQGQLQTSTQVTAGSPSTALSTQQSVMETSATQRCSAVGAALAQHAQEMVKEHVQDNLGPFFGLPVTVKDLLNKHRGIAQLYDWQSECIKRGATGSNLLVSLPTSGGKTLVAEVLLLRTLLVQKKHAIFLLPYVAIVQEKVRGLAPLAVELGFLLEEYAGSKGSYPPKARMKKNVAFVATIEKATGLLNSFLEEGRAGEVGLLVVDEAHMLGEGGGRGALLEATITKLRHCAKHVQIVAMSATISNLDQLASFLDAQLYTGDFRPVKLRQYVKINDVVAEINPAALTDEELLTNHRTTNYGDQDGLGGLVREVVPQHSVLVFCPTRRNCESVARLLCTLLPRQMTKHNRDQKQELYHALAKEGGGSVCPVLREVLPYGVAYHHSGLTEGERKLVEEGYLAGTLCTLTCTSTLAAGVNLPARRVVLRSPYTGRERLTRTRYTQMVGRAGRTGMDSEGESFLVLQPKDVAMIPSLVRGPVEACLSRLCDGIEDEATPFAHATAYRPPRATPSQSTKEVTFSGGSSTSSIADQDLSRDLAECSGLRDLIFSSVGLGLARNPAQVLELVECSLMALQAEQRGVPLRVKVMEILQKLRTYGMLRIKDPNIPDATTGTRHASLSTAVLNLSGSGSARRGSQAGIDVTECNYPRHLSAVAGGGGTTTQLEDLQDVTARLGTTLLPHHLLGVSRLGRAAIKGCVELCLSSRLYEDLLLARSSLAVHSRLHLLYLVTPYSAAQEISLVPQHFYRAYCSLSHEELKVAELIGVTEAVATKVAMGKTKALQSDVVKRFNAAIIIHHLLSGHDIWKVSEMFEVPRGMLQRTLSAAAAFASCVHHFCQELEELWAFRDLLASFSRQLSGCCSAQLLPLLDLPAVKLGRARLLFAAGYTSLHAVANADPAALVKAVHHLPEHTARQLVSTAKALLLEKAEALQEEAEQVLLGLVDFSPVLASAAHPRETLRKT